MDAEADASATVRLAFPPQARLLGTIRLVVGIVARKAGMDEEGVEDLKVVVSETCAVAVGDLNRAGVADPIEIDLVEAVDRFGIEVRDRAPAVPASPADAEGEVDDLKTSALAGGGNRTSFWLRRGPLATGALDLSPPEPQGLPDPDPDLPPPLT